MTNAGVSTAAPPSAHAIFLQVGGTLHVSAQRSPRRAKGDAARTRGQGMAAAGEGLGMVYDEERTFQAFVDLEAQVPNVAAYLVSVMQMRVDALQAEAGGGESGGG